MKKLFAIIASAMLAGFAMASGEATSPDLGTATPGVTAPAKPIVQEPTSEEIRQGEEHLEGHGALRVLH